jgi:hypothetical protein
MAFSKVGPNQSIEWGQIRVSKSKVEDNAVFYEPAGTGNVISKAKILTNRYQSSLKKLEVLASDAATAHFLRIQTRHVTGPASLSVIGRPANLRANLIWP